MTAVSKKLRKLGLDEKTIDFGPDKASFHAMLAAANLTASLNPIRKQRGSL
jgi:hypothetical protein